MNVPMADPNARKHGTIRRIGPEAAAYDFLGRFRYHQTTNDTLVGIVRDMQELRKAADAVLIDIVDDMRIDGWSWGEVGEALGVTRQAARQRYGGYGIK